MRTLEFVVDKQQINKNTSCDFTNIVAGTKGYLKAAFSFSKEWDGCRKVAVFESKGNKYAVAIQNGECEIPSDALTDYYLWVYVVGEKDGYRITSNKVCIEQERIR